MNFKRSVETSSSNASGSETENDFSIACLLNEKRLQSSYQSLSKDYQEYVDFYHKFTSFYFIIGKDNSRILRQNYEKYVNSHYQKTSLYIATAESNKTKLIIYNPASESEETKTLDTLGILNKGTCIAQLPNGELFCFGKFSKTSGIALIIDKNYKVRVLPSEIPCYWSSAIYFNGNVYCFGGWNPYNLALSMKFDLSRNRWTNLTKMPRVEFRCHSVVFNGNILISGFFERNLMLYSITIDSFSIIPCRFGKSTRKILISAKKLYLIEFNYGSINESKDGYNWEKISESIISYARPSQAYCSYNKGRIYIATSTDPRYYKFDLSQKIMIELQ